MSDHTASWYEWQVGKRYFSAGSLQELEQKEVIAEQTELMAG